MTTKSNIYFQKLKSVQCIILPGKLKDHTAFEYYQKSYNLWKNVWIETFAELKSNKLVDADDFLRQDIIIGLFYNDQAIGAHLYNFFDLTNQVEREHSYFKSYPKEILHSLQKNNPLVVTMEYLTVHPDWRKNKTGLPLGEVILGLACKILASSAASAMIAPTRNNRKVNEMVYKFGGKCLAANLTKHNVDVDIVSYFKGQTTSHPSVAIQELVDTIWANRHNYTTILPSLHSFVA